MFSEIDIPRAFQHWQASWGKAGPGGGGVGGDDGFPHSLEFCNTSSADFRSSVFRLVAGMSRKLLLQVNRLSAFISNDPPPMTYPLL